MSCWSQLPRPSSSGSAMAAQLQPAEQDETLAELERNLEALNGFSNATNRMIRYSWWFLVLARLMKWVGHSKVVVNAQQEFTLPQVIQILKEGRRSLKVFLAKSQMLARETNAACKPRNRHQAQTQIAAFRRFSANDAAQLFPTIRALENTGDLLKAAIGRGLFNLDSSPDN